jgi:hypothetical protein
MHHAPPTIADKRLASVTARLAIAGIELRRAPSGAPGFVAVRWNLTRALATLDAAEVFAAAAMDRIR